MFKSSLRRFSTPSFLSRLKNPSLFRQANYIDGQWVKTDATIDVVNPATDGCIGRVPDASQGQVVSAIQAAQRSFDGWKSLTANERGKRVARWGSLMMENKTDLGLLMTLEQGKPLAEAEGEIVYAASFCSWFAEEGKRAYGQVIPPFKAGCRTLVQKHPVGVVGIITPWNFPSAMVTRKAAAGLAAGCTLVCKPSELTPFSALALAELAEQAGIPRGVFNVVTGDPQVIGKELTSNFNVRKISFTGSTRVGKHLFRESAEDLKRISLELGGNAPYIVFGDADIDKAVSAIVGAKFRNAGQTCITPNRIFVHFSVIDEFTDKLITKLKEQKLGSGTEAGITMGPLINTAATVKVERLVSDAISKGSELAYTSDDDVNERGSFSQIRVLRNVSDNAAVQKEEIFGPVAPLMSFVDEEEVLAKANDTEYGLAAYFFTRDVGRIFRVSEGLQYGMVGVNDPMISSSHTPFGGIKHSGLGREGGSQGIDEYMDIKYSLIGL